MIHQPPRSTRTDTLFPYSTLFRSVGHHRAQRRLGGLAQDRETFGARVELTDVGRAGHETALHHQQAVDRLLHAGRAERSEEHTSELQSLMRISYAVFCLKKKTSHVKSTN